MTAAEHLKTAVESLDRAAAALNVVVTQRGDITVRGPAAVASSDVKTLARRVRLIMKFAEGQDG